MLTEGSGLQVRYNEARPSCCIPAFRADRANVRFRTLGANRRERYMRVTLAASALMLALAAPAQGIDKQVWAFFKSDKETLLFYGVPESEAVTLIFRCEAKREGKRIEIISTVLPRKPRKGQPATTTLSNGAVAAAYRGKFGYGSSEEEGFHFEASTVAEPAVTDILKSGTSLTISIPGKHERVPLRGVAKPLAQFETACFRKR